MPLLGQLRIKELKRELADRELVTTGTKATLLNRLRDALIAEGEANPDVVEFEAEAEDVSMALLKQMQQMQQQMQAQMQRNFEDLCRKLEGPKKGKFAGRMVGDMGQSADNKETPNKGVCVKAEPTVMEKVDVDERELIFVQDVSSLDSNPVPVELHECNQQMSVLESHEAAEQALPRLEMTTAVLPKEISLSCDVDEQFVVGQPEEMLDGAVVDPCVNGFNLTLEWQDGNGLRGEVDRCGTTDSDVSSGLTDELDQSVDNEILTGSNETDIGVVSSSTWIFQSSRIVVPSTEMESGTAAAAKEEEMTLQGIEDSAETNTSVMSRQEIGFTLDVPARCWMEHLTCWRPTDLSREECRVRGEPVCRHLSSQKWAMGERERVNGRVLVKVTVDEYRCADHVPSAVTQSEYRQWSSNKAERTGNGRRKAGKTGSVKQLSVLRKKRCIGNYEERRCYSWEKACGKGVEWTSDSQCSLKTRWQTEAWCYRLPTYLTRSST